MLAIEHPDESHLELLQKRAREALDTPTRLALAAAFRGFLTPDEAGICEAPPFAWCGTMSEARTWARGAHRLYLKAVVLAAFEAMPDHDREAFLDHIQDKRATQ